MLYVNAYIQTYTSFILLIILLGNILIYRKVREKSEEVFFYMLFFGFLMLFCGGVDNYLILRTTEERNVPQLVMEGISDMSYFTVISLFTLYLDSYAKPPGYKVSIPAKISLMTGLVYGVFWFLADFSGSIYSQNAAGITYGPLYYVGQAGGYLITLMTLVILALRIRELKRTEGVSFVLFIFGPLLASQLRAYFPHVTIMPIMVAMSLIFIQIFVQGARELYFQEQQTKLTEIQTDLLMSRMKPHFAYNVLNSIYVLCDKSVDEAKEAIAMFAQYLRTGLVDLDSSKLIPFEDELEHVRNYLNIEKIRFEDRLKVEYDIGTTDFMVPPLCLQAIAENSVKHGIAKKIEGGLLTIASREENGNFIVTVTDNGVGFDPNAGEDEEENQSEKRKHVGMYSASYRLEKLCGGNLRYESEIGRGTRAIITIPAKNNGLS